MFFELTDPTGPDRPHLGFLIAKNPASPPFVRALGGASDSIARQVIGRYHPERPNTYVIVVDNDEVEWMQRLKDLNQPHYVSTAPYVVNPTNLKGIGVALKTALDGKDPSKGLLPEGEVSRPRDWSAVLGPFALPDQFVLDTYRGLGLAASIARAEPGPEGGAETPTADLAWLLPLSSSQLCTVIVGYPGLFPEGMPLAEFLQKVLVGAYALTIKQHTEKYLSDSLVASLMQASLGWLGKTPISERVIQRLTQGSTDLAKQWSDAIRGEDEEAAPEPEEKPQFASLHARRHERILAEIPLTEDGARARNLRVVDLGCGDGKLTVKILKERAGSRVLSIDADDRNLEYLWRRVRRAFKKDALNKAADHAQEARAEIAKLPPGETQVPAELATGVLASVEAALTDALEGTSIKKRFSYRRDNVAAPYLEAFERDPDVVVLSEVIEHLSAHDRAKLVESVAHLWRAKRVIITTPNREYNPVWGLGEGEWRHKDHQIEYAFDDLYREVLTPLRIAGYDVRILPLLTAKDEGGQHPLIPRPSNEDLSGVPGEVPGWGAFVQPSWIVVADRRPDATEGKHNPVYYARGLHEPLHLHESGYTVSFHEMLAGLCHPVYLAHREPLAYLAPTVPPVEFNPEEPSYLEHPSAAFAYYRARGVSELVAERKYMGSRLTVVAFKDHESAYQFGHPVAAGRAPLFAWSRQGYPFFDDPRIVWRLHESLHRGGFFEEDDVVVLDGEFLPWAYKAGRGERNLITQAFVAPGEAALVDATYKGSANNVDAAKLFLKALGHHTSECAPAFVPFDCKLRGKIKAGQRYLSDPKLAQLRPRAYLLKWLAAKVEQSRAGGFDSLLQACEWHPVYLDHAHVPSELDSVRLWRDYCEDLGGEGFVYKPMRPEVTLDGAPVQPALKVRGREYLRLIYGIHYLETPFFEKVQKRRVGAKRRLAMQENLLADRILRAFMRGERREKDRYVAAFLGADGVQGKDIDATL